MGQPMPSFRLAGWRVGSVVLLMMVAVTLTMIAYMVSQGASTATAIKREALDQIAAEAERRAGALERRFLLYDALHGLARAVLAGRLEFKGYDGPSYRAAAAEIRSNLSRPAAQVRAVGATDAQGLMAWYSDDMELGATTVADRPFFQAIRNGAVQVFLGSPVLGRFTGQIMTHYAKGVYSVDGRLQGVTVLTIDPQTLTGMRAPIIAGRAQVSALFAADGTLISSTEADGVTLPAAALTEVRSRGRASLDAVSDTGRNYHIGLHRATELGLIVAIMVDFAAIDASAEAALTRLETDVLTAWSVAIGLLVASLIAVHSAQRRQAEARERTEAEHGLARLTELAESLQDMVVVWEEDGRPGGRRFTYVSPSSMGLLGVEPEALCAEPRLLRFHADDVGRLRERLTLTRRGENDGSPEQYRLLRRDGSPVWVEVVSSRVARNLTGGGPHRFVSCFRDISAGRAAEAALAEANRRLESVTTNSPATRYEVRGRVLPDGSFALQRQFIARSAARVSGYTMEELETPGFIASVTRGFLDQRPAFVGQVIAEGRSVMDYTMRRRDGTDMRVRDTCFLTSRDGTDVVMTGFAADVSEEALLREQLLETSKLSFLGEMAAGIAHELHQPLAAIELHAETLALEIPAALAERAKVVARVAKISALVERAGSVIRRIRAFSRRDPAAAAPFDPAVAIDDGLAIIERRIADGRVAVIRRYPDEAVRVLGHQAPFEQVIMNLVTNAVDAYGPPTGGEAARLVTVTVARSAEGVEITVADRAGGISPAAMGRLFEPFFTTKPQGVGTGLGLSISYRIVHDMGGRIRADNRDGGAVFTVVLPAVLSTGADL